MPPRHVYWTIIVDDQPTAFRAGEREDLLPTFNRLKEKHPSAVLRWFERGKLWASREEAQAKLREGYEVWSGGKLVPPRRAKDRDPEDAVPRESRGKSWRPGGEHRDPREKYQLAKKAKWARLKQQWRGGPRSPEDADRPRSDARGSTRPAPATWKPRPDGARPAPATWKPKPGGGTRPAPGTWRPKPAGGDRPAPATWKPKPGGDRRAPATWKPKPGSGARPAPGTWRPKPGGGDRPAPATWKPKPSSDRRAPATWKPKPGAGARPAPGTWRPKPGGGDRPAPATWKPKPSGDRRAPATWKPKPGGRPAAGGWKPKAGARPPSGRPPRGPARPRDPRKRGGDR